jgi:hypothetical protein
MDYSGEMLLVGEFHPPPAWMSLWCRKYPRLDPYKELELVERFKPDVIFREAPHPFFEGFHGYFEFGARPLAKAEKFFEKVVKPALDMSLEFGSLSLIGGYSSFKEWVEEEVGMLGLILSSEGRYFLEQTMRSSSLSKNILTFVLGPAMRFRSYALQRVMEGRMRRLKRRVFRRWYEIVREESRRERKELRRRKGDYELRLADGISQRRGRGSA